jgi:dihydroorotate dehydrogenase (NAD+) catalytic subunit
MGGVRTGRDALELIAVGARHVALGTVLFADPDAPTRIRTELWEAAAALGFVHPDNAYGCAHGGGSLPPAPVEKCLHIRANVRA